MLPYPVSMYVFTFGNRLYSNEKKSAWHFLGSALISLYFNFPTLYFPYTLISLYFNFPTLISLHYDFPIHKRLSYKIRSNQGHTGRWAGWAIVHPCFDRLESALQFNNACANFAMPQVWPCLKVGHAPTPSP